jgi:RNA polymerase sigma-70 factor (ECF subfamily)
VAWVSTSPSLLQRVRNPRDRSAWDEFDRRYGELILRFCRHRGLSQSDAEDVRQNVLMSLAKALPKFDYNPARGRFRSYLGRVVRNAVQRRLSCPNREWAVLDNIGLDSVASDDREFEATWDREWTDHHLRRAMQIVRQTYDPRSLDVFERLLKGHSIREVARDMSMSAAAVQKVKQRVQQRLKNLIAEHIENEESA